MGKGAYGEEERKNDEKKKYFFVYIGKILYLCKLFCYFGEEAHYHI